MASERCGLTADSFHEVAIGARRVHVVIENLEPGLVEIGRLPFSSDGHSYTVANALA